MQEDISYYRFRSFQIPFQYWISKLVPYITNVEHYYDDSLSWAFASSSKKKDMLESDSTELSIEQTVSFLKGMSLIYNDGLGSKRHVTFIGIDFVNGMQQKWKVQKSDGSTMAAYLALHFIENPGVALISQTSAAYYRDCQDVTPSQLKQILNPKSLSPLQEEMMSYHNRLHHLPFPKLLILSSKGEIPKRLATLKWCTPICVACIFVQGGFLINL